MTHAGSPKPSLGVDPDLLAGGGGTMSAIERARPARLKVPEAAPSAAAVRTMAMGNSLSHLPATWAHMARRK